MKLKETRILDAEGAPCPTLSRSEPSRPGSPPGHLVLYCSCLKYALSSDYVLKTRIFVSKSGLSVQK